MIARVVRVKVTPGRREEAGRAITDEAVPLLRQLPGFVAAYWLAHPDGDRGMTVLLWEGREQMQAAEKQTAERRAQMMERFGTTLEGMDDYEVIAHS